MSIYVPVLVTEAELRNAFTPALTTSEISVSGAVSIIEMTELYIRDAFCDGTMPSANDAKMPALALCMTKVVDHIPSRLKSMDSFSIGDYSVKYTDSTTMEDYVDTANTVLKQLDMKSRSNYIYRANR